MSVKLLTEHNLEFLSLEGGCTGSSESTLVKMPHYWKSHAAAQILFYLENTTCDPFIYTMDHPKLIVSYQKEESISAYGKCSKISNTLKLRTPKIIAENNF